MRDYNVSEKYTNEIATYNAYERKHGVAFIVGEDGLFKIEVTNGVDHDNIEVSVKKTLEEAEAYVEKLNLALAS